MSAKRSDSSKTDGVWTPTDFPLGGSTHDRVEPPIRRSDLLGYAIGSIGTGIFSTVPSILLLFYMTDSLGLPPLLAALAIFIPKIWAIGSDPVIGAMSDRTRSRWGRRRPWLLAGGLLLSVGFVLLFRTPHFAAPIARFGWVLSIYLLCSTAYSIFAVPYVAIPSEMSSDPAVRTTIMSWRMAFVTSGVLIGAAGAPALVVWFGGGAAGYAGMSAVLGGVIGVAMLTAFARTRSPPQPANHERGRGLAGEVAIVLRDALLRRLVAAFILQAIATSLNGAMLPYAAVHLLGRDQALVGTLFFILIASSLCWIPVWARIAVRSGKRTAFLLAAIASCVAALSLVVLRPDYPLWALQTQFFLMSFGFAGLQVLPFSMITDVIQHDGLARGGSREGLYTGFWTAAEKLSYALGPMVAAAALSAGGYIQSSGGHVAQPAAAILAITLSLSLVPAILYACAVALIRTYPLTESHLGELIAQRERQL